MWSEKERTKNDPPSLSFSSSLSVSVSPTSFFHLSLLRLAIPIPFPSVLLLCGQRRGTYHSEGETELPEIARRTL